jgi:hypothetical protein
VLFQTGWSFAEARPLSAALALSTPRSRAAVASVRAWAQGEEGGENPKRNWFKGKNRKPMKIRTREKNYYPVCSMNAQFSCKYPCDPACEKTCQNDV